MSVEGQHVESRRGTFKLVRGLAAAAVLAGFSSALSTVALANTTGISKTGMANAGSPTCYIDESKIRQGNIFLEAKSSNSIGFINASSATEGKGCIYIPVSGSFSSGSRLSAAVNQWIRVRFKNVVKGPFGTADLLCTFTIKDLVSGRNRFNYASHQNDTVTNPNSTIVEWDDTGFFLYSGFYTPGRIDTFVPGGATTSNRIEVHMQVVKSGTTEVLSGSMLMSFADLDQPRWGYGDDGHTYHDAYVEGVKAGSNMSTTAFTPASTGLQLYDGYVVGSFEDGEDFSLNSRSACSFLCQNDSTFLWQGNCCWTKLFQSFPMGWVTADVYNAGRAVPMDTGYYSLAGAVIDIYNSSGTLIHTVTTDASGNGAPTKAVSPGTYSALIRTPSTGFKSQGTRVSVTVTAGTIGRPRLPELPLFGHMTTEKVSFA